ncbi:MAG: zinc ribbon domain-containing protein [Candidatus Omnitrophica bacterium]|nr:zinc ribbon domain-containing protein [Candidatus Omnitrophota bacterium]MBD3269406.1 zinc ribbon domain-containing protein [Candidatus Omnitrophota bacterium]
MPLYSYTCKGCGKNFDLLVGVTSEKTELKCQECGSKSIKRIFGSFSLGTSNKDKGSSASSCPAGTCPL